MKEHAGDQKVVFGHVPLLLVHFTAITALYDAVSGELYSVSSEVGSELHGMGISLYFSEGM